MNPGRRADQEIPDDDAPLDPAEMLALLRTQQDRIERRMAAYVPAILAAWGIAWLVGFLALWLIDGAGPGFSLPAPAAATIFAALMVAALGTSAVLGIRSSRGIRADPQASFTGTVYGLTWPLGFVAIYVFGAALMVNGMPRELANIYYPIASTLFVGIMYVVAGAIWHTRAVVLMGAWIVVVALVAPFLGYPTHYLLLALAGGGVFLAAAIWTGRWVRDRRSAGAIAGVWPSGDGTSGGPGRD